MINCPNIHKKKTPLNVANKKEKLYIGRREWYAFSAF